MTGFRGGRLGIVSYGFFTGRGSGCWDGPVRWVSLEPRFLSPAGFCLFLWDCAVLPNLMRVSWRCRRGRGGRGGVRRWHHVCGPGPGGRGPSAQGGTGGGEASRRAAIGTGSARMHDAGGSNGWMRDKRCASVGGLVKLPDVGAPGPRFKSARGTRLRIGRRRAAAQAVIAPVRRLRREQEAAPGTWRWRGRHRMARRRGRAGRKATIVQHPGLGCRSPRSWAVPA